MKNKILRVLAFLTAMALIAGLGLFANALVGNPISKWLSKRTAEKYIADTYPNTDFEVESVSYSFKTGGYYAYIHSPSSVDGDFTLYLSLGGALERDDYEERVIGGWNTADRLNRAYRELTDSVLESSAFPFVSDIAFGDLECTAREYLKNEDVPTYTLVMEELEQDRLYDIRELGAQAGHLVIYVQDEQVTIERAAEIILEIKRLMQMGGAPFYAMDFVLEYPKAEENWQEGRVEARGFLCEDIYEEGMEERVKAANEQAIAYYAEQDGKK